MVPASNNKSLKDGHLEHRTSLNPVHTTMGWFSVAISRLTDNQRGVALITVVLVALAVSSVAIAASMMTMSGTMVRRYSERNSMANHAALSGVERGLSALLADGTLYPTTGYTTLEDSVAVLDAVGSPIPGIWRSIYLGPSSDPSRGSIVSEVWTRGGVRAVRRMEVQASSFASYGDLAVEPEVAQYLDSLEAAVHDRPEFEPEAVEVATLEPTDLDRPKTGLSGGDEPAPTL